MTVLINPATRVGEMLSAYPGLEAVLESLVPPFAALKNPALRNVVMKSATLEQAARTGGLPVVDLIRALRKAAGLGEFTILGEGAGGQAPAWVASGRVVEELDGDRMLGEGVHPVGAVRERAASLGAGEVVCLKTSFRPDPLIELMRRNGLEAYSAETEPGRFSTYFGRPA